MLIRRHTYNLVPEIPARDRAEAAFHWWRQSDRLCCSQMEISVGRSPPVLRSSIRERCEKDTEHDIDRDETKLTWKPGQDTPVRGKEGLQSRRWSCGNSWSRRWSGISASRFQLALIMQLNSNIAFQISISGRISATFCLLSFLIDCLPV